MPKQKWLKVALKIKKKKLKRVVFSLPQTNHYQTIKDLSFSDNPIFYPDKWGNSIAVWENKNQKEKIAFKYLPKKVKKEISDFWTLDNYFPVLTSQFSYLLEPNRFINGGDKEILKTAKIWQKEKNLKNILQGVYYWTIKNLEYGNPILGLYSYKQALRRKKTDCGGFSTLMLSLFQSLKIPGRLVVGFLIKSQRVKKFLTNFFPLDFNSFLMHVWVEVLLPNQEWFPLDPAIEWRRKKNLTKREGGFGFIPADRLVVSFGQDFALKIKKKTYKIDLLQHPVNL